MHAPRYDDYWRHVSVEERFDDVECPAHVEGGWFDIFLMGTLNGVCARPPTCVCVRARVRVQTVD